jgi:hypothetical protein
LSGFLRKISSPAVKKTSASQTYCIPFSGSPSRQASPDAAAANTSNAINPRMRSMRTTVVATVFDPV